MACIEDSDRLKRGNNIKHIWQGQKFSLRYFLHYDARVMNFIRTEIIESMNFDQLISLAQYYGHTEIERGASFTDHDIPEGINKRAAKLL